MKVAGCGAARSAQCKTGAARAPPTVITFGRTPRAPITQLMIKYTSLFMRVSVYRQREYLEMQKSATTRYRMRIHDERRAECELHAPKSNRMQTCVLHGICYSIANQTGQNIKYSVCFVHFMTWRANYIKIHDAIIVN